MPAPIDNNEKFSEYTHPEVLVSTQWLSDNLGNKDVVVLESDEDVLLYEIGHIPVAFKIDWHTDLNDPIIRDYIGGSELSHLFEQRGINPETTIVIYGDKSNWWATYALWVFKLFGHKDVRILDGGRDKWIAEGRELSTVKPTIAASSYPVLARNDEAIRAFKNDVLSHLGKALIDVRSPEEFSGERTHMPAYPEEGALRGGHIPGAASVPWARAVNEDGTYKSRADLEALYLDGAGLVPGEDVIVYCRIGERSSHSWFALKYLLGFDSVRNYDGSWTEWGSAVRVPIAVGA
jgi:thiosulfate/3-mercaptopyruvate sulfurtransferase